MPLLQAPTSVFNEKIESGFFHEIADSIFLTPWGKHTWWSSSVWRLFICSPLLYIWNSPFIKGVIRASGQTDMVGIQLPYFLAVWLLGRLAQRLGCWFKMSTNVFALFVKFKWNYVYKLPNSKFALILSFLLPYSPSFFHYLFLSTCKFRFVVFAYFHLNFYLFCKFDYSQILLTNLLIIQHWRRKLV